jgi:hypothetical protein
MKLHFVATDYGEFLQNEPSPLHTTTIAEKCTQKLVKGTASPFLQFDAASDWCGVELSFSSFPQFSQVFFFFFLIKVIPAAVFFFWTISGVS